MTIPARLPGDSLGAPGAADDRLAWSLVSAAGRHAASAEAGGAARTFAFRASDLRPVADDDPGRHLRWEPGHGWVSQLAADHPAQALLDLYLPICGATRAAPITIGHLGQSLDGFIATHEGESRWVTGHENLVHMHRLRALCDAVVVGAGTVAADDPQLTTRLVEGPTPLRVVLDPGCRLATHYRVFSDPAVATLCIAARSRIEPGRTRVGCAELVGVADAPGGLDLDGILTLLRERGCARIFVEGGGRTVSSFVEASLLDRLHVTIAPLIIGDGRPAIRLPRPPTLSDCHRPRYRVFRMGADVLFDCDLRARDESSPSANAAPIVRVI